eukprot:CAMPEP_0174726884 /NCGR_PEP_ID=MMETSP1094-20130205/48639_1 /TAXON_ID=156173 /ORGANISM="Chrysochromulina brevifilum, Strain UTEX LB 985" /LENGTH=148 /DNA_ID=CAMNT_0015928511 /DNA_START=535 /DNA_END=981 /DNA_ORIENTATION=+
MSTVSCSSCSCESFSSSNSRTLGSSIALLADTAAAPDDGFCARAEERQPGPCGTVGALTSGLGGALYSFAGTAAYSSSLLALRALSWREEYLAIFCCSFFSIRSTACGVQLQSASSSSLVSWKPIFLKGLAFSVFQLYIFCAYELAAG